MPIADATAALMKRANDTSITKPEDIAGKTVGGQKGTSQLAQLKAFAAKLPKPVEVKEYVDNNQSYADLAAGESTPRSIHFRTSPTPLPSAPILRGW